MPEIATPHGPAELAPPITAATTTPTKDAGAFPSNRKRTSIDNYLLNGLHRPKKTVARE